MIVKMHQAKTQLSKLVAAALAGEEVVIARGTEPVVRLMPLNSPPLKKKRQFGRYKGLFEVPDDVFAPLSEEELSEWAAPIDLEPHA